MCNSDWDKKRKISLKSFVLSEHSSYIQAHLVSLRFAFSHFTDVFFYKLGARPSISQKDHSWLYCSGLKLNVRYRRSMLVLQIFKLVFSRTIGAPGDTPHLSCSFVASLAYLSAAQVEKRNLNFTFPAHAEALQERDSDVALPDTGERSGEATSSGLGALSGSLTTLLRGKGEGQ